MSWATEPVEVMSKLAEVEDSLSQLEQKYAEAAGHEVELQDRFKLTQAQLLMNAQGATVAERQAYVDRTMADSPEKRDLLQAKSTLEYCKAYFKVLDARRSSLQSLLAIHKMNAEEARFGRGRSQAGVGLDG